MTTTNLPKIAMNKAELAEAQKFNKVTNDEYDDIRRYHNKIISYSSELNRFESVYTNADSNQKHFLLYAKKALEDKLNKELKEFEDKYPQAFYSFELMLESLVDKDTSRVASSYIEAM